VPMDDQDYAVSTSGFDTPRAAAGLVIGAVIALVLIARGFRGVNVGGISVGVK
jgi:hypothetical protein